MAPPAAGSVPLPNSSISTSERGPASRSIAFISCRNDEYVERSFSRLWSSPIESIICSKTGSSEVSEVGTSMPHWNMYCSSPAVLRHTLLPPALGPEMSRMCFSGFSSREMGTIFRPSPASAFSSSGWRAFRSTSRPSSEITGIPAVYSMAVRAFAIMKSSSPTNSAATSRSGTYGRRKSENSISMRSISSSSSPRSSWISFSSSITSSGSTKAVFPVDEISYT